MDPVTPAPQLPSDSVGPRTLQSLHVSSCWAAALHKSEGKWGVHPQTCSLQYGPACST